MMVTALNVITVFTDEFDCVKPHGKLDPFNSMFRHYCDLKLHYGKPIDEERRDLDPDLCPRMLRIVHATRLHLL